MIITLLICILVVFYIYAGYPLALYLIKRILRPVRRKADSIEVPSVSVVIAAHNEEENIVSRLQNLSEQDYPNDKLEIIIVSDGSTDNTVSLVKDYSDKNKDLLVKVFELPSNQGKPASINKGVERASGDILVFTDARQEFDVNVITELVSNFSDPDIGCVSGELFFKENRDSDIHQEMGVYWKYEKFIRKTESSIGSVVGVTGAIYAMRRSLYKRIPADTLIDDVLIPMQVSMQGYRVVFDEQAIAYDIVSSDTGQEWKRKVRTLSGNWQLLLDHSYLLNPVRNHLFIQFLSHKVLRLAVPFLMMAILLLSFLLIEQGYLWFFVLQLLVYALVIFCFIAPGIRKNRFINLVSFFTVLNAAVVVSFYKIVIRRQTNLWQAAYKNEEKD